MKIGNDPELTLIVGAENIHYLEDGTEALTMAGLRRLTRAIRSGAIPGDADKAARFEVWADSLTQPQN